MPVGNRFETPLKISSDPSSTRQREPDGPSTASAMSACRSLVLPVQNSGRSRRGNAAPCFFGSLKTELGIWRRFSVSRTLRCLSCRRDKRFTAGVRMLDFAGALRAAHENQQANK